MSVWLNADQVAERIGVSKRTALTLMYQMPHSIISGTVRKRIRVSEDSLEAWMLEKCNILPQTNQIRTGSKKRLQRR